MIEKYEIKYINNEERLFIYINMNYEFANFNHKSKKNNLEKMIKDYIKKNNIIFKGSIISLVVGSTIIGNIIFNNDQFESIDEHLPYVSTSLVLNEDFKTYNDDTENTVSNKESTNIEIKEETNTIKKESNDNSINKTIINTTNNISNKVETNKNTETKENITTNNENNIPVKEEEKEEETVIDNNIYIFVKKSNGTTANIELEEYVLGVVGAEMPASFNIEALKAQAIIARTYALKAKYKGNNLSDNERTQSYKTNDELKDLWGNSYNTYYNKIKTAVDSTKGMYLTYNGTYIEAVYHSTSNGQTESSTNVWGNYYPYLVSVSSSYDNTNTSFQKDTILSYETLSQKLGIEVNEETEFNILSKTSGNRIEKISVNDKVYKGTDFRNLLGLRSADFDINKTDTGINFTTRGYGHGVGLSQYGAGGMAKNGYNYQQILSHYYPGTNINIL